MRKGINERQTKVFYGLGQCFLKIFEGEGQLETGKRSRAAERISSFERGQQFEGPDVSCIY